jgi:hypothetical protein
MRRLFFVVTLVTLVGLGLSLHGQDVYQLWNRTRKSCDKLTDSKKNARTFAAQELLETRKKLSSDLAAKLTQLSKKPDNSWQSPLHLVIQVIGLYNVEEAITSLAKMIDYQIDKSTVPAGDKLPAYAYFPASDALRRIGGLYVAKNMIARLSTENNEKVTQLCVWVLFKAYGKEIAALILQDALSAAADNAVRDRLRKAKDLIAKGDRLLVFDK